MQCHFLNVYRLHRKIRCGLPRLVSLGRHTQVQSDLWKLAMGESTRVNNQKLVQSQRERHAGTEHDHAQSSRHSGLLLFLLFF